VKARGCGIELESEVLIRYQGPYNFIEIEVEANHFGESSNAVKH